MIDWNFAKYHCNKITEDRKFESYILNETAAVQKQQFMSSKVHIEFSEADCTKVHMIRLTAMKIGWKWDYRIWEREFNESKGVKIITPDKAYPV